MEALVTAIPVAAKQIVVIVLHGVVGINVPRVVVQSVLIFVDEAFGSIQFPCKLKLLFASHKKRMV